MNIEQPFSAVPTEPVSTDPVDRVIGYHVRTKHHFNRYARALGYLDWANQPNPFRRFEGSPLVQLPLLKQDEEPLSPGYDAIYEKCMVPVKPFTIAALSRRARTGTRRGIGGYAVRHSQPKHACTRHVRAWTLGVQRRRFELCGFWLKGD